MDLREMNGKPMFRLLTDRLLEHYRLRGHFRFREEKECFKFGQVAKEWAKIHERKVK